MIHEQLIDPATEADMASAARRAPVNPVMIDHLVCRGLRQRMSALAEAGMELKWPVVRAKKGENSSDLEVNSPYFFLNERADRRFKKTPHAKGVSPIKASDLSNYGYGDHFIVAMRNPDTQVVDVMLYSEGVLSLYRDSMSRNTSVECLAALPPNADDQLEFVESAIDAAVTRLNHYLTRVPAAPTIQVNRDISSRHDLARYLAEEITDRGDGDAALAGEVKRIANDPEVAERVNGEGCVEQLKYLLLTVGEERTRTIVSRCIRASAVQSPAPAV